MKMQLIGRYTFSAIAMLVFSLLTSLPVNAESITLNSALAAPLSNDNRSGFIDIIATEVFKRNGLELSVIHLPAERALRNSNSGIQDGELVRVAGMEKNYPNLIQVPEKMIDIDFVAFTNNSTISIKGWDSLGPYSVGLIKGWKIYEKNVPEGVDKTSVENAEQLFSMLEKGRIDVALYTRFMGLEIIQRRQMAHTNISGTPLATKEMFMYLHKKHSDLVMGIAQALTDIKTEGLYDIRINLLKYQYSGKN